MLSAQPTALADELFVCILRALAQDENRAQRAARVLDLNLLDHITWPEFLWEWLRLTGNPLHRHRSHLLPQKQPAGQLPAAGQVQPRWLRRSEPQCRTSRLRRALSCRTLAILPTAQVIQSRQQAGVQAGRAMCSMKGPPQKEESLGNRKPQRQSRWPWREALVAVHVKANHCLRECRVRMGSPKVLLFQAMLGVQSRTRSGLSCVIARCRGGSCAGEGAD